MQWLRVSGDGRRLETADGTPFFWLGDTAWELFHKLSRDDTAYYLAQRANLGFNVVQAVALAELNGLTEPNAHGRLPLRRTEAGVYDPARPDTEGEYSYWDHVDYVVDLAAAHGIYVALLPTWGDKYNLKHGAGPVVFTESNARAYGEWIGARYRDRPNVVWVLGGDRPLETYEHFAIVRAMAEGLTRGDGGAHLKTFHPAGARSSSLNVHGEPWLDFHMIQSGHGERDIANDARVRADYALSPAAPTLDGEPCYEDIAIGFDPRNGYFDAADVRKAAYYAVFSGALGHTYGHHSVWSMTEAASGADFLMSWREALERPGAAQMRHLKTLMTSRPFKEAVPDAGALAANYEGANRMVAIRGARYAYAYTPSGAAVPAAAFAAGSARVRASWFDPRAGAFLDAGEHANDVALTLRPPSSGRGCDWILVLDAL